MPRRVFSGSYPSGPSPSGAVKGYHLQRTRIESIAERKLRRRLTEDGNVEISGRACDRCQEPPFGSRSPNGLIRTHTKPLSRPSRSSETCQILR